MSKHILSTIEAGIDLHGLSHSELQQLADEIREVLCGLLSVRTAHFASNLGVVELCLALHSIFDFRKSPDLGHRPSNISAQVGNWPVCRVFQHPNARRLDGLSESGRKSL